MASIFSNQLSLEYTLPLIARRPGEVVNRPTGFVHEFDCELNINWWDEGEGEIGYELEYVAINDGPDRFTISKATDPELFALLVRGFEYELRRSSHLHDRICDTAWEQADEGRYHWEAAE